MQRKEFGRLVAALRQELGWTQAQLAHKARLDLALVSQVERGVKSLLDAGLLVKLADAFQLTTLERKEFFFASTGIEARQIVRSPVREVPAAEQSLHRMMDLVGKLRIPAFLLDAYTDVLAINFTAFTFFQIPLEMLAGAGAIPGGMNALRLVFGKDLAVHSHFLTNWEYYALSTMRFFREASLCYRASPYFQYLMKAFRDPLEYPLFERYWRMVSSVEQDRDGTYERFDYDHDVFGHLSYAVATTVCITPEGELYLNQYIPTDDTTWETFNRLAAQSGSGVIPGAPWPEKSMVQDF